jgi:hypothetical protein
MLDDTRQQAYTEKRKAWQAMIFRVFNTPNWTQKQEPQDGKDAGLHERG